MRFKGTLVLLIVVLALGGYIYFYEIKGGEQREKAKEPENQIWKFEDKNIQQMELSSPGQHITAVRKGEKEWILTAPQTLDADSDELEPPGRLRRPIYAAKVLSKQNAADLAKFGLNPAQIQPEIKNQRRQRIRHRFRQQ